MALQSARAIVEAGGLEALTARKVAGAIGYSAGTLYNIFENLDDLILHLNGRLLDEMHERLTALPQGEDPDQDLRRLLDGYLAFIESRPNLWALLFEHSLPEGRPAPDWYRCKVARVLGVLEATFLLASPGDTAEEAKRSARILWASLHGIWSLASTGKLELLTKETARDLAETLFRTYLAGFNRLRETHHD